MSALFQTWHPARDLALRKWFGKYMRSMTPDEIARARVVFVIHQRSGVGAGDLSIEQLHMRVSLYTNWDWHFAKFVALDYARTGMVRAVFGDALSSARRAIERIEAPFPQPVQPVPPVIEPEPVKEPCLSPSALRRLEDTLAALPACGSMQRVLDAVALIEDELVSTVGKVALDGAAARLVLKNDDGSGVHLDLVRKARGWDIAVLACLPPGDLAVEESSFQITLEQQGNVVWARRERLRREAVLRRAMPAVAGRGEVSRQ